MILYKYNTRMLDGLWELERLQLIGLFLKLKARGLEKHPF